MAELDDALSALQAIQTDDADASTQVANAIAAVQAAQSGASTVDPTWTAVQAALTANGWSPPVPEVPPASADASAAPADGSSDVSVGAPQGQ